MLSCCIGCHFWNKFFLIKSISLKLISLDLAFYIGRRIGGDRKKYLSGDGDRQDNKNTSMEKITPSQHPPMPLVEQRLQRLKAAEERLKPTTRESSAVRLTPLGVIMELKQKV